MEFLVLTAVVLILLAGLLFWSRRVREQGKWLILSESGRRVVAGAAVVVFLILFALHLVWTDALLPFLVSSAIILIFFSSQLFWLRRGRELLEKWIASKRWQKALARAGVAVYFFLFVYNIAWSERHSSPTHLTLGAAIFEAPFTWWVISSLLGFALIILLGFADRVARVVYWGFCKVLAGVAPVRRGGSLQPADAADPVAADPPSPSRRRFLEQTATAVSAVPFVAGAYGLFYGRLNLETSSQRIKLSRLPKAFHGFRLAQLSDIHIGPFMSSEEIRKYVEITNEMKPDLVLLTGDFVTWDPATQGAVVQALAGLKAPFGVFGSLGNHEYWSEIEESITRLFAAERIRILRQERAALHLQGETLNLLGVDYESVRGSRSHGGHFVRRYLERIEHLVMPDTVNILLSHNPNTFDRAAQLGIDLSLAGHTHGGQVTLEFIHPSLSPSRLITSYVKGWFQKPGGQLYVNRGLGTIGVPMRLGAPPEITVFELTRS